MPNPASILCCFLLFFLSVQFTTVSGSNLLQHARVDVTYKVNLNRIVGRAQSYNLICREETSEDGVAIGRAEMTAPKSAALERGFLRCVLHGRPALVHDCSRGRDAFEHAADRLFKSCAHAPPLPKKGNLDVRNFNRDNCKAFFARFFGQSVTAGLFTCECLQQQFNVTEGDFFVIFGRAFFNAEFAPGDSQQEVQELEKCASDTQEQLQEVCLNNPEDYELLALHILQVCCKRLRKATDAKFQCAAVVPDDVTFLKYVSIFGN